MNISTITYFVTHLTTSIFVLFSLLEYHSITTPFFLGAVLVELIGHSAGYWLKKNSK